MPLLGAAVATVGQEVAHSIAIAAPVSGPVGQADDFGRADNADMTVGSPVAWIINGMPAIAGHRAVRGVAGTFQSNAYLDLLSPAMAVTADLFNQAVDVHGSTYTSVFCNGTSLIAGVAAALQQSNYQSHECNLVLYRNGGAVAGAVWSLGVVLPDTPITVKLSNDGTGLYTVMANGSVLGTWQDPSPLAATTGGFSVDAYGAVDNFLAVAG